MRLENEHTHYRARFEIFPYDNTDEVGPFVMQVLCNWLREKEYGRHKYNEMSQIYRTLDESTFSYREEFPQRVSRGCYFSKRLLEGLSVPTEYDGGAVRGGDARICARAFEGDNLGSFPQYWAMDYDEPDGRMRFRRWHTSVGMTCSGNTCVVNVRITNYLTPGYMGNPPEQPSSTTPRFVKELISLEGCQTCVGETVLHVSPVHIGAGNFQTDFVDNLLSDDRELPMITVVPKFDGGMPVDVDDLALKVQGIANVYDIDYSEREVRDLLRGIFVKDTSSGLFHLGYGWVRVYEPRVDLASERNAKRHRFFRPQDVDSYGDTFNDMLTKSLTRNWFQDDGDIIDVVDVDAQSRQARNEELRLKLERLGKRAEKRGTDLESAVDKAREAQASNEELRGALAEQGSLIDRLRGEAKEWELLANEYASQVDSMTKAELVEKKKVQAQIAGYEDQALKLKGEKASLDEENRRLRYTEKSAQERCDEAERNLQVAKRALSGFEKMERFPTRLSEALLLIRDIYSGRVVVLKEAINSAKEFDGHYRLDEEWQILKSVPTVLWDLHFGPNPSRNVAVDYQLSTGFELSLGEGSMTNKDGSLMKKRVRKYCGKTIKVIPHIKGRDTSPREAFRLHYYVDKERKVIVIGHCGGHLETAGTRRNT